MLRPKDSGTIIGSNATGAAIEEGESRDDDEVSDMMRGDFTNLSERKLMDCPTRLGYDIEIKVRPAKAKIEQLMLSAA